MWPSSNNRQWLPPHPWPQATGPPDARGGGRLSPAIIVLIYGSDVCFSRSPAASYLTMWASYVAVGKLCGRGQAMWPWASCEAVGELSAAGELYVAGEQYVTGGL
jgi:hypothetical protein